MHLQPSVLGGGCEEMEPWSGCASLQIMYTASEIAFLPDQGDIAITKVRSDQKNVVHHYFVTFPCFLLLFCVFMLLFVVIFLSSLTRPLRFSLISTLAWYMSFPFDD